ncbi:MAG: tryptophan--tRNA ligase [Alphaproteobacteria bacterium]|nr:tryptophan--tRNA ligase [Alphaproteobacteria bacterium]
MDIREKTILTGVKPTGRLHIGNYVGAIRPAIDMGHEINKKGGTHVMFIADYHSLNFLKDPAALAQAIREIACVYLAGGLDPGKSLFYRQSDVPELFELATILMAFTPKGYMNKAHAYKAAVDKNTARGDPVDAGINMGLYTYPVLMAADILAYDTDIVPVGKDQVQHVEMAADIAGFVNAQYGKEVLKKPVPSLVENAALVPGTDGRKMSKSYGNVIPLFGTDAEVQKAVMSIKTDSQPLAASKNPDDVLLYQIARGVCTPAVADDIKAGLEKGGVGYGAMKKMILADIHAQTDVMRDRFNDFMAHPGEIEEKLAAGAAKARAMVGPVLKRLKETIFGG